MFVIKEKLCNENEDRGDDLPGANPFVGGEEHEDAVEEEDRGDVLPEDGAPDSDPAPAEDSTDSGDADDAGDGEDDTDDSDGEGDDAEEPADGDSDDEPGESKPSPMIPKKRFDAVNERMKRAEARLRDLEKQREAEEQVEEDQFDFDAKEEAYMEAVLDGDTKLAKQIRKEIRTAEQALYESKVSGVKDQAVEQTQIKQEFDDAVASLEAASGRLDPNSGDFDEDLVNQIVALQGGLLNSDQGYTPGEALLQAAQYVMGDELSLDGEPEAPAPAPAPAPKPKKDVKKKVAAAQRAPADMSAGDSSSTAGEGVIDIDRLSEKEFDALPESKKRELRGDVI